MAKGMHGTYGAISQMSTRLSSAKTKELLQFHSHITLAISSDLKSILATTCRALNQIDAVARPGTAGAHVDQAHLDQSVRRLVEGVATQMNLIYNLLFDQSGPEIRYLVGVLNKQMEVLKSFQAQFGSKGPPAPIRSYRADHP